VKNLLVAGALALALVGCGAAATGAIATSSPTVVATPASTVAPTPTPDGRAIAAQQYLAAVTADNTAVDVANAAQNKLPNSAPWSASVPSSRKLYAADQAEETAVFAIHFPPDMAADASAIISALNSELATLGNFIRSPGQSTWDTCIAANTATGSASNAVRHDLGLPPVPLGTP
jgi:hypothetical protein